MAEPTGFPALLLRLRRRILIQQIWRWLKAALPLALVLNLAAAGLAKITGLAMYNWSVVAWLVLLALSLAALYALRTFRGVLEELRSVDERLGLKDRLSTAYECHLSGRESVFVPLLYDDAARRASAVSEGSWFPFTFSRSDLFTPLLAAALAILLLMDIHGPGPGRRSAERQLLSRVSQQMAAYARPERKEQARPKEEEGTPDAHEKLRNLAEAVKNEKMDRKELTRQLSDLLQTLKEKRLGQVQRLEADLSPTPGAPMDQLRPLAEKEVRPEDVRQARAQLEPYFDGELPASLARSLDDIEASGKTEAFIEQTLKDLGAQKPQGSKPLDLAENAPASGRSQGAGRAEDRRSGPGTAPGKGQTSAEGTKEKEGGAPGDEAPPDQAGSKAEKNDDEGPYVAGHGTSNEKMAPSEMKGTTRPPEPDTGLAGQGERYSIHLRSLPAPGRAGATEEEVLRPYRRAVEEALKREDIPPAYRAYIKNYFLSIGLGKDETGKDDHARRSPD